VPATVVVPDVGAVVVEGFAVGLVPEVDPLAVFAVFDELAGNAVRFVESPAFDPAA